MSLVALLPGVGQVREVIGKMVGQKLAAPRLGDRPAPGLARDGRAAEQIGLGSDQLRRRRDMARLARATARHGQNAKAAWPLASVRSEEHTSELQSLMRISYAVFCL